MSEDATAVQPAGPVQPAEGPDAHRVLGRRNDRLLVWLVAGYIALLTALMIARGISLTPDVLLIGLGLAAVLLGRGRLFLRDWIPFIGLFFAYELMRGYADDLGVGVHVADVLAVERWLFLGHVPTTDLQAWLHPASGTDYVAVLATVFYFLHFPLPLAVGFFLWLRRRRVFYDYVAALIVLSMAGFVTYLLLPVAPPWYAAEHGLLPGVEYLKKEGFAGLAALAGFRESDYLFSYTFYSINPNEVAAFPSLHAGYPFLAFLFARRTFGRVGWLMLLYA
ncbi:MAG TPA: phosphatase PAP2 family protein, partial [Candidatus Limnocylindrales bacterium]